MHPTLTSPPSLLFLLCLTFCIMATLHSDDDVDKGSTSIFSYFQSQSLVKMWDFISSYIINVLLSLLAFVTKKMSNKRGILVNDDNVKQNHCQTPVWEEARPREKYRFFAFINNHQWFIAPKKQKENVYKSKTSRPLRNKLLELYVWCNELIDHRFLKWS